MIIQHYTINLLLIIILAIAMPGYQLSLHSCLVICFTKEVLISYIWSEENAMWESNKFHYFVEALWLIYYTQKSKKKWKEIFSWFWVMIYMSVCVCFTKQDMAN